MKTDIERDGNRVTVRVRTNGGVVIYEGRADVTGWEVEQVEEMTEALLSQEPHELLEDLVEAEALFESDFDPAYC